MVLVGALLFFGERLNLYQWAGVLLAVLSFFMLSRSGKKEGIDFQHNKWILFIVLAAVTGAVSGLYDKYLMTRLHPMLVQSWYNVYQVFIMCPIILLLWYPQRKTSTPFHWKWTIVGISLFLCAADFAYFYALSYEDSMISIVSWCVVAVWWFPSSSVPCSSTRRTSRARRSTSSWCSSACSSSIWAAVDGAIKEN